MWDLRNRTPFAVAQAFERDEEGHEVLCLAVRASFMPRDDGLADLAKEQAPVLLAPEYVGEELAADADILPFMPGAELLVSGYADSPPPGGRRAQITLGALLKACVLHPVRILRHDDRRKVVVETGENPPVPLRWSQAFGGAQDGDPPHPANPVGIGRQDLPDGTVPLPRILAPNDDPMQPDLTPVGFGPIHRHWQPRLSLAGTYDAAWQAKRAPLLPRDFDRRFHHAAPADQQFPAPLKGGERLVLEGFGETTDMSVRLPQVLLAARVDLAGEWFEPTFALRRVRVDLAARRFDMLWLATVPCDARDHLLRRSTIRVRQMSGVA